MGFLSSDTKTEETTNSLGTQTSNAPAVTVQGGGKKSSTSVVINQESPEALALAGSLGSEAFDFGSEALALGGETLQILEDITIDAVAAQSKATETIKDLVSGFTSSLTSLKTTTETGGANLLLDSVKYLPQMGVILAAGVLGFAAYRATK